MTVYRSGKYKLSFSMEMNRYLNAHQQDFMQEDTQAGMIYAYLEDYTGDRVCSKPVSYTHLHYMKIEQIEITKQDGNRQ